MKAAREEAGAGSSVPNATIGASSRGSGVPLGPGGKAGSQVGAAEENNGLALHNVTTDVSFGSGSAPPPFLCR